MKLRSLLSLLSLPFLASSQSQNTFSFSSADCPGYSLSNLSKSPTSLRATLSLIGGGCTAFGNDIKTLTLEVNYETKERLHVHIYDTAQKQYQVPPQSFTRPPTTSSGTTSLTSDLSFNYILSPFSFYISRRSTNTTIFDTRPASIPTYPSPQNESDTYSNNTAMPSHPLVFEDYYLQLSSALPQGAKVVGLGEVVASSGLARDPDFTLQTFWNRDVADPIDSNIYGTHPIYIETRYPSSSSQQASLSHGVFLLSSVPSDILLRPGVIQYRLVGGTLDFYFFSGPTFKDVVSQYVQVTGLPQMSPYWSFGFHLCRYGYPNLTFVEGVVQRMEEEEIPEETQWVDIDVYHDFRDFTNDPVNWPADGLRDFIGSVHQSGRHFIPIVDAAIAFPHNSSDFNYDPWLSGTQADIFIKTPEGEQYIAQVWPGAAVYPDWFAKGVVEWWTEGLKNWTGTVAFDGIWLDMNEPSSFCVGPCFQNLITLLPNNTHHNSARDLLTLDSRASDNTTSSSNGGGNTVTNFPVDVTNPPYAVHNGGGLLGAAGGGGAATIEPNATHQGGIIELNAHNLFGLMEEYTTNQALQKIYPGKRPFIIGRSTFPSAGRWTGHWLGDNWSTWEYMKASIAGILQFQVYGIPMVGSDACGFNNNTTETLCNRWMQLAAFTPFYRNHNAKVDANGNYQLSQEPYQWPSVANASRIAMGARYSLLPYFYTAMAQASLKGTPAIRALYWDFDDASLFGVYEQFLFGPAILVTPVLTENATSVDAIFPGPGPYRDWWTYDVVNASSSGPTTLDAPLSHINLHIVPGNVLLLHAAPKLTIADTQAGPYSILVSLSQSSTASGSSYHDDGESLKPSSTTTVSYTAKPGSLTASPSGKFKISSSLSQITVLGVAEKPSSVTLGGKKVSFSWTAGTESLVVSGLKQSLNSGWTLAWK